MRRLAPLTVVALAGVVGFAAAPMHGTDVPGGGEVPAAPAFGPPVPPTEEAIARATREGIDFLLGAQEGPDRAEWPYEGVYRVGGVIPYGYRVGGTGIVGRALLRS
jgi:hypothetical protein